MELLATQHERDLRDRVTAHACILLSGQELEDHPPQETTRKVKEAITLALNIDRLVTERIIQQRTEQP